MKLNFLTTIMALLLCSSAFATTDTIKQIDLIQNSAGGAQLAVPSVGTTFDTDSNTVTLTNKTISGSSNTITNISTSSLASGFTLGVTMGGLGLTSVAVNELPYGSGTNTYGLLAAPSQYQVLMGGSGGALGWGAVNLAQSAAVTGVLGHANGGSDSATLAGGAANFLGALSGSTTSGYFLEYNGSNYVFAMVPSVAPSLNGGSGTAASITASGGVSLSSISYANEIWVAGSGGAVTVTSTPNVTACTADGQGLKIHGTSNTNTVTLQDHATLSGSGLYLNGPVTLAAQQTVTFHCDATLTAWVEDSRSN